MGGSLGLAARERAGATTVVGCDPDPAARDAALARGCVDEAVDDARGGGRRRRARRRSARPSPSCRACSRSWPSWRRTPRSPTSARPRPASSRPCRRRCGARFIGGHPICGMETRGAQNARAELFEGATWYLTPLTESEPARAARPAPAVGRARRDARSPSTPGVHDRLLAVTSHLPHALANLLVVAGRRGAHRRPRPAHGGRRLVPRHDARGRREPAHLGRHLPRQPRGARGRPARAPRALGEVLTALEAGDAGYLARWIGAGVRAPPPLARRAVRPAARGALPRPGAHPRPPRRVRGHHAGARRGADQHRGLRVPPLHARARRHDRAARGRRRTPPSAPSSCSTARATARSRRPSWRTRRERRDRIRPPRRRARGRARRRARGARRQVDLAPRAPASARSPTGTTEVTRLRRQRRHARDARRRRARSVRASSASTRAPTRLRVHGCGLRGLRAPAATIDVHNAGTLMRLLPGLLVGQSGSLHARRRRVDPPPPGRPRGDAAAR